MVKASDAEVKTAVVEKEEKEDSKYEVYGGEPLPLGATPRGGGVNFAVYSSNAVSACLCLFSPSDLSQVIICCACYCCGLSRKL